MSPCRSLLPHCSANMGHSGWIWVWGPTSEGRAVSIRKPDGLPETAHPEASPSSLPYLPVDVFAHLSLPSYLLFSRLLPKGFFPSLGFICPFVRLLILKALFLSVARFFKDQSKFKLMLSETQKLFGKASSWQAMAGTTVPPARFLWFQPRTRTKEKLQKLKNTKGSTHISHTTTVCYLLK